MSEYVDVKGLHDPDSATARKASAGATAWEIPDALRRLLPASDGQRRMALWSLFHMVAATIASALLWRTLPTHLLFPWLIFMWLTGSLYLLRGLSPNQPDSDQSHSASLLTFMAATFGIAWGGGAVIASTMLETSQQLLVVLSLAPLAALTAPLLYGSLIAPRLYAVVLAAPGTVVVSMNPEPELFASAFATALVAAATLWAMRATNDGSRQLRHSPASQGTVRTIVSDLGDDGVKDLRQSLAKQKQALFAALQDRDRARATLQALNEAVVTTDSHGRIDYLNPAAEVLIGCSSAAAVGKPATEVIVMTGAGGTDGAVSPVEQSLLTERTVIGDRDTALLRRDGTECGVEYTCAPVRDGAGRFAGLVLSMRDVSETRDMQARLSWAATHDALTGLINRREFEARLDKLHASAVADGSTHALCFIDLDHFKSLNDTCGHLAGDDFLKGLAEMLRGRVRGADTLARLGGDEFAVLLYSCPLDVAERIAENLRRSVAEYCASWKDQTPLLGASIGVVAITGESKNLNDILATADLACYAAKTEGRNRVNVFRGNTEMLARWQGEVRWLQSIQTALEQNRFQLYWQPMVPLAAGDETRMCELFVHLRDSDEVLHPPADFMPTAQRYHLMPAIDFWVASMVVNALRTWHPTLSTMDTIAINLSTQSVTDERFERELLDMLADTDIPAYKLCFQIGEAAFMSHPARVRHFTARLKARGCRLAVEGCGIGAGSFNHLRRHEIDYLKIHDEFTGELIGSALDREVVSSLHRIARCMGGRTIAERIADEAVLQQLRELGIDYAQGYALAKPQPLDKVGGEVVSAVQVA